MCLLSDHANKLTNQVKKIVLQKQFVKGLRFLAVIFGSNAMPTAI